MAQRYILTTVVLLGALAWRSGTALAQQKGQWLPGFSGLNAGVMADPGFTCVNLTVNYSSTSLTDKTATLAQFAVESGVPGLTNDTKELDNTLFGSETEA